jgi:carboxypeptidase family protein/TonB-dependent receptor-like protein
MTLRTLGLVIILCTVARLSAAASGVSGHVTDPSGLPLPGVVVTLSTVSENASDAQPVASSVTDDSGQYNVDVPGGQYAFTAELSGFQPVKRVVDVQEDVATVDVSLTLASFQDSVTITAQTSEPPLLAPPQPNAPVTVSRTVINAAMLPNSRYEDVLTLMPNVERGPDNRITVGGAPASAGSLVVNGFNETDPADGLPGVVVPVDAVDSVDVHTGGYAADLGRATSGVTSIQTRSGANQFHTSVDSIFPRFLFENGGIHGVEYWEPNIGASGPIVKGRLFFESALSYRFDRNRFTTLAGPERSTYNQPLFWTQLDGNISSKQRVRLAIAFDQQHTDHANITAFTPAASVPKLAEDGWSTMLSDHIVFGHNSTLDLNGALLHTKASVEPNGSGPYLLGHSLANGAYFDDQSRLGRRTDAGATLMMMPTSRQVLKAGGTVDHASLTEADTPSPVNLLRSNSSVSRIISFEPSASTRVTSMEASAFVDDEWNPRPSIIVNAGVRVDRFGAIADNTVSPRLAWTLKPGDGRTSVSGSVGLFVDKFVLGALAFPEFPTRVVQAFTPAGGPIGQPQVITNAVDGSLRVPRAERWDIGLDHTFTTGWIGHVRYQERHGRDELILQPTFDLAGTSTLALSSSGHSTERGIETTIGYHSSETGHEFYVSYVRSQARGDLNTFEDIEGLSKDPFVQPNQIGPLAADLPNRLIAWGLLRIPGGMTFAPFLTVRNGFPYSTIDDDWVYVGPRNGSRLPWFASLDISVTRVVDLPRQLPRARVGLKLYNLVAINTDREIQRDIAAPDFGVRYDPVPRDFSLVCVFLLGRH